MKFDLQLLQVRTQLAICGTLILSPLSALRDRTCAPDQLSGNRVNQDLELSSVLIGPGYR
jgi:hypothetical protein